MREIFLTQGKVTFVDDADYEELSKYKWYALKSGYNYYAVRNSSRIKGKQYRIYMHRYILGLNAIDKQQADHINHNTLDNRRINLRICTRTQNGMNRKSGRNTSSRFKGVIRRERSKNWEVAITIESKYKYLGCFKTEKEAAFAYNKVAKKYFGEFANLNVIV